MFADEGWVCLGEDGLRNSSCGSRRVGLLERKRGVKLVASNGDVEGERLRQLRKYQRVSQKLDLKPSCEKTSQFGAFRCSGYLYPFLQGFFG